MVGFILGQDAGMLRFLLAQDAGMLTFLLAQDAGMLELFFAPNPGIHSETKPPIVAFPCTSHGFFGGDPPIAHKTHITGGPPHSTIFLGGPPHSTGGPPHNTYIQINHCMKIVFLNIYIVKNFLARFARTEKNRPSAENPYHRGTPPTAQKNPYHRGPPTI